MLLQTTDVHKAEIVVVGSGPGGAVAACMLAEDGKQTLLVEEGSSLPLESCAPFSIEEMRQKYRNGGVRLAFGNPQIVFAEGKVLGGGSEINSGLYHRTPAQVLERWRKNYGVEDLSEKIMAPIFESNEKEMSVSTFEGKPPPASLKLAQGAGEMGWDCFEVPRMFARSCESGRKEAPFGGRNSMSKTYLPMFLKAGGTLLTETRILGIQKTGNSWILSGRKKSGARLSIETKTLFLACGAVETPALLRRSGITRNVGDSLSLHPTIKVVAEFNEEVNFEYMGVPFHQVKTQNPARHFGCSASAPSHLALGLLDHPEHMSKLPSRWRTMAVYYVMVPGGPRGKIRTVPGYRDCRIHYQISRKERSELCSGLQDLSKLLFAAGAESIYPSMGGIGALRSTSDLKNIPSDFDQLPLSLMTIHLFSSCPMGERKDICAADSFGRVHGQKNLYLSDASLLCDSPGVNPQGSIMAIVRRNILRFLGKS